LSSNHFHLALWPRDDDDLSRWMPWLMTSHVHRYLAHYHRTRHVWQGRFRAFPIEEDDNPRASAAYSNSALGEWLDSRPGSCSTGMGIRRLITCASG